MSDTTTTDWVHDPADWTDPTPDPQAPKPRQFVITEAIGGTGQLGNPTYIEATSTYEALAKHLEQTDAYRWGATMKRLHARHGVAVAAFTLSRRLELLTRPAGIGCAEHPIMVCEDLFPPEPPDHHQWQEARDEALAIAHDGGYGSVGF